MATKSGILATINSYLTAVVTIANHRLSMGAVVDELYPTVVTDSQATETYTTKGTTSDLNYSITIHKSGNTCHIKGVVSNNRTYAVDAQNVFTWKENAFKPKSGDNDVTFRAIYGTGGNINLFLNNNVLALTSSINALGSYSFDFKMYIAQN